MARRNKQDANETKNNIVNAAIDTFYKYGVAKTSLEDIARAAGVTRGAIYWHFEDKVDLLIAIFDQVVMPECEITNSIIDKETPESLEELKQHIKDILKDITGNERERKIMSIFFIKLAYSKDLFKFFKEQNKKHQMMSELTTNFFRRLQEKGIIKSTLKPEIISSAMYSYTIGLLTEYLRNPSSVNLKENYSDYVDFLFSSL